MTQVDFEIRQDRVWLVSENTAAPTKVSEHWQSWQSDHGLPSGLETLGVGRAIVTFAETNVGATVNLHFLTEVGMHFPPSEFDDGWDHFIDNDFLVPVRPGEVEAIFYVLGQNSAKLGKAITLSTLFRLLVEFRQVGISIDVPASFERLTKFEPKAANLDLFQGSAYQYQSVGIDWLTDYFDNGLGALLCDEMGLGKTFQAIGLIAHALMGSDTPVLIVAPATLVENWKNELAMFLPSVAIHEHLGSLRAAYVNDLKNHRVILTTYDTLIRDASLFQELEISLILCDEAQALKSRHSQRHQAIRSLSCRSKVLITGTPVENRLTDLVALVDIVHPGLLGDPELFEELLVDTPNEAREIGQLASPLILRRRVSEVAQDLPALIEIETPLVPSQELAEHYDAFWRRNSSSVPKSSFLATLTALTQICCHPKLVIEGAQDSGSTKFDKLYTILSELNDIDEDKVIIFSTYLDSIDLIVGFVSRHFGPARVASIDGRLPPNRRQGIVDSFNNEPGFKVLVINPKAGGTGLNITGANHVVHFNRQWNPAVEAQATARAYRRKQEKPVFVHKFYYLGTVEEVIHERLAMKSELADAALEDAEAGIDPETKEKMLAIRPRLLGDK